MVTMYSRRAGQIVAGKPRTGPALPLETPSGATTPHAAGARDLGAIAPAYRREVTASEVASMAALVGLLVLSLNVIVHIAVWLVDALPRIIDWLWVIV
jgi:hypothetical protein